MDAEQTLHPVNQLYVSTLYDAHTPTDLASWLRPADRRVLDVGCGAGRSAEALNLSGKEVHGVTLSALECEAARPHMSQVHLANIENWHAPYADGFFDALFLSHVVEHLVDPRATLQRLARILAPTGRAYLAVPNVLYWRWRWEFLMGFFEYRDRGPLDYRHLRFFTFASFQKLVREAGFQVVRAEVRGHFPLGGVRRVFPRFAKTIDALSTRWFAGLFGYEILVCAAKVRLP